MARITRVLEQVLTVVTAMNCITLFTMAVLISVDVIVRWMLKYSIRGIYEISEVMLVTVSFMAIAQVQYSNSQLRVDVLSMRAKGGVAAALRILDILTALIFFAMLIYVALDSWFEAIRGGYLGRGILQIPTAIPLGILVAGTLLMLATLILLLIGSLVNFARGKYGPTHAEASVTGL